MSKIHLDRLKKRYPNTNWTGKKYNELIQKIMIENTKEMDKKLYEITESGFKKTLSRITTKEKRLVVPDLKEIKPLSAISTVKAAQKGKLLTDELRGRLTSGLRETLNQFTPKTGELSYLKRRGAKAGQINTNLSKEFEVKIKNIFQNYIKKDPKYGVPANIKNIAVTEVNGSLNSIKRTYVQKLSEHNPDLKIRKKWLHFGQLSKEPRQGHRKMAELKPKKIDEVYYVPLFKKSKGTYRRTRLDKMVGAHDQTAPPDQNIGCHCDMEYLISWGK